MSWIAENSTTEKQRYPQRPRVVPSVWVQMPTGLLPASTAATATAVGTGPTAGATAAGQMIAGRAGREIEDIREGLPKERTEIETEGRVAGCRLGVQM